MRTTWTFHSAGQLLFGREAVQQLGEVAGRLGARRLLVVTDPILSKTGLVERVQKALTSATTRFPVRSCR
jgi:alcohol dehydrogenase class IV